MSPITIVRRLLKHKLIILAGLIGAAYLVGQPTASALPPSPGKIPNGAKYWCDSCHVAGSYAANTQMKLDFLNASPTKTWTVALAQTDSDGDGWTNGEEMQDPAGAWVMGQADPGTLARVSNPSQITSYPPEPLVAFTGVAGGAIITGKIGIGLDVTAGYPTDLSKVVFELANFDGDVVYTYTDTGAPFCFAAGCAVWDSASVPNDVYTVRALAYDKRSAAAGGPREIYRAAGVAIDNPEPPRVEFQKSQYSVGEAAGTVTVVVKLSDPSDKTVTVAYASDDDSAKAPDDYGAVSGTLTFVPGQTSTSFQAPIEGDTLDEADETFDLELSDPTNAELGDRSSATVTIQDDDAPALPSISIAAGDPAAAEAGPDAASFTVTRSGDTSAPLLVGYTMAGTAISGSDYAPLAGSVTIPADQSSAVIVLAPIDDSTVEETETVTLTLGPSASYSIGAPASATATIADDDTEAPSPTPAPTPNQRIYVPVVARGS
jgi:hypothetical protein